MLARTTAGASKSGHARPENVSSSDQKRAHFCLALRAQNGLVFRAPFNFPSMEGIQQAQIGHDMCAHFGLVFRPRRAAFQGPLDGGSLGGSPV